MLASWNEKNIHVPAEVDKLKQAVMNSLYMYKVKQVRRMLRENLEQIKVASQNNEDTSLLQEQY
jgi:hypothetical protein